MNQHPYSNPGYNKLYNLLFADDPGLFQNNEDKNQSYPWNIVLNEKATINELKIVAEDISVETRVRALACNILKSKGHTVDSKELLGIIVEVGLEEGLDVLAAYTDGTARYINHVEKMTVWDAATDQSQTLIKNLFSAGLQVVKNIGPWNKDRLPAPAVGDIRINFLVADGLYFGQGPFEMLERDPMGGPVIRAATQLMVFLIQQQHPEILVG